MNEKKRIVIVGGVAGGASAAARLRRLSEDAEITMLERGEHVSFANCGLPYHIGGEITDRSKLLVTSPELLENRYRINVRTRTEAIAIDREQKTVAIRDVESGETTALPYDYLLLSPGASPVVPPMEGRDHPRVMTLRSIADMDRIKAVIDKGSLTRVVMVGGGFIGLEMAEALVYRGKS